MRLVWLFNKCTWFTWWKGVIWYYLHLVICKPILFVRYLMERQLWKQLSPRGKSMSFVLAQSPHLEGQVLLFVHSNSIFSSGFFPCILCYRGFKQIYPVNHATTSSCTGCQIRRKLCQLWVKLVLITVEARKCVSCWRMAQSHLQYVSCVLPVQTTEACTSHHRSMAGWKEQCGSNKMDIPFFQCG